MPRTRSFYWLIILISVSSFVCSCGGNDYQGGDGTIPHHAWMASLSDSIGDRMLRDIALPGSHDSGMNEADLSRLFGGASCNSVTQTGDIYDQLMHGARYFDIRPVVPRDHSPDDWRTAHVDTEPVVGLVGSLGESKQDIVYDLEGFFDDPSHDNELVILKISHCYTTELTYYGLKGRALNHGELTVLYRDLISRLPADRLVKCHDDCNLMEMTLNEILARGNIILLMEGIDSAKEIGVFRYSDLPIYDEYANTESYDHMVSDQLGKLKGQHNRYSSELFLLSFMLTLSNTHAEDCPTIFTDTSILKLATEADGKLNSQLKTWVQDGWITKTMFPNIIYVDAFNTFATDAAAYLNGPHQHLYFWESGTGGHPGAHYRMQGDGNLCIYPKGGGHALWCSGTGGYPGATLCMRIDGNMVIYDPSFEPIWSTHTDGHPGAYYVMGDDGNFVIKDTDGTVLWATHTGAFPGADFRLQDGNFQIYRREKTVLWESGTGGHPGAYYRMQDDGNFVIYPKGGGHALWATGTGNHAGAYYVLGEDGNFVIKGADGKVWWESGTRGNPGAHYEMQKDGNFVIYKWEDRVLWESGTGGHKGAFYGMLSNGNFVVYMPNDKILWQSGTAGHWGAYHHMNADGNLVLYTEKWDR